MANKKYISLKGIQYTFPVAVKKNGSEKVVWVSFKGDDNDYVTSDKDIQDAVEASGRFKNKEIGLSDKQTVEEGAGKETEAKFEPAEFKDVTDINGAVAILSNEPYNVDKRSLKTPVGVSSKAKEYNVEFPNLKLD
ncbi:MAG: hypothetical protein LBK65_09190 [Tannerellaceae bacterium]|jgi:hypothetical protein|nr:hypothetical protein [Tannerellaceae bacterium]